MTLQKVKEKGMEFVFMLCACVSILAVALICIFLFANGVPAMAKIGFGKFLMGRTWQAGNGLFGIFPMIIGSIYVTAGAIIVGVPIGIQTCALPDLFWQQYFWQGFALNRYTAL